MSVLFEAYPRLNRRIPHVKLGMFPTPVQPAERLGADLGVDLWIKRDDRTGPLFGGNKVRKLEYTLAAAREDGARTILTFGGIGSNHACATAVYAQRLALGRVSMLLPHPNSHNVRRNLLLGYASGAELRYCANTTVAGLRTAYELFRRERLSGERTVILPPGGSTPLGTVGYVAAAFELKAQIDQGLLPEPDLLYVAFGTAATAAGLILGLRAAGLKTEVVPVRVVTPDIGNSKVLIQLFQATKALLRSTDPSFPDAKWSSLDVRIRQEFFGPGYAAFTPEGQEAVQKMKDLEGLKLEGTYTGKALSALIADARSGGLKGKKVLFWNTFNSVDFTDRIANVDYRKLPKPFHTYFESAVQPLDKV